MHSFTANLNDYKDSAGEIDETKIKAYQTAKDILAEIKADSVMNQLITNDTDGKEIIDINVLNTYKTLINRIGGTATIAVNTYKHKLQNLLNDPHINTGANDNWENHLISLTDYHALNSQLQQVHQTIIAREQSILTSINNLGLDLNNDELTLPNVLAKIKNLLKNPDLQEIKVDEIKTLPKIFSNSDQTIITQIKDTQNYQQLANIRNSLIKNHLDKNHNQLVRERVIFIVLLISSLLTIGLLFKRMNKLSKKNKK